MTKKVKKRQQTKPITGDTRLVQDSDVISSGIKELWRLKSQWLVSALINYEHQTGWCCQMKQNMFGCGAQPSNDAGKQKENCPLRWLEKSFLRNRTSLSSEQQKHFQPQPQQMYVCSLIYIYMHMQPYLWSPCWPEACDSGTDGNCFQGIVSP